MTAQNPKRPSSDFKCFQIDEIQTWILRILVVVSVAFFLVKYLQYAHLKMDQIYSRLEINTAV